MTMMLALWDRPIGAWGIVDFLKLVILIVACVAVAYIAFKAMGWTPPQWLVQMAIVVAVAFCAILAITLIASM